MSDYTIKRLEEVTDVLGDYPGEMRMMTRDLEAEQPFDDLVRSARVLRDRLVGRLRFGDDRQADRGDVGLDGHSTFA